ncbi:hydroxyproline O-galactosyltransferase GALT2-like [Arachis duranensis]|uniref:Hydroxyproline O-galactosyltransferase GALT2-like n=1 Tax=Arachis duranensis TaxID=130453 RepID=A0A9C6TJJ1_ARADU|nr:hydroxyproline O-galactosyltransferase GALT2-like [Arachis duranensis]
MLQRYHALPERQPPPPIKRLRSPAPQLLPPPHQCFIAVCVLPRVDVVLYGFVRIKHLQCRFPQILKIVSMISGDEIYDGLDGAAVVGGSEGSELRKPFVSSVYRDSLHRRLEDSTDKDAPLRPNKVSLKEEEDGESVERVHQKYGRIIGRIMRQMNRTNNLSVLERMTDKAWTLGLKAWEELDTADDVESGEKSIIEGKPESCPSWISMTGDELQKRDGLMFLPCGLAASSSITMVGTPHFSHKEYVPKLRNLKKSDGLVTVSQFIVELQGLKLAEGEAPSIESSVKRRLEQMNSIEHNTCYRMHWKTTQRCDGLPTEDDEGMLEEPHCRGCVAAGREWRLEATQTG